MYSTVELVLIPPSHGGSDLCASLVRPNTWSGCQGLEEAEKLPMSFKGGSKYIQTPPWTPWSP